MESTWILRWKKRLLGTNRFLVGPKAKVQNADILKLCGGLKTVLTSLMVEVSLKIHICTHNLNIAQKAETILNRSSHVKFVRYKELAQHLIRQRNKITV